MMRLCSSSVRDSSFSRSDATNLVTGMPVHREMTLATSPSVTAACFLPLPMACANMWLMGPAIEPVAAVPPPMDKGVPGSPPARAAERASRSSPSMAMASSRRASAESGSPSSSASLACANLLSISSARFTRPAIFCWWSPPLAASALACAARSSSAFSLDSAKAVSISSRHVAAVLSVLAFSFKEAASICSWLIRLSSTSRASGFKVASILTWAAASSTRSMALSGRKRPLM
mmetsp:Transcript_3666/g.9913  ORF Transcript_3666/g.9913 Transcript_3666/m.9913 type:complete len:233 (-) Transcript_3666:1346-2044(-)